MVGNGLHDFDLTVATGTEAAALAHQVGDLRTEGAALGNIGQAQFQEGQIDEAEASFRKCEALLHEAGDLHGIAMTIDGYAQIARVRGDLREAARIYRECVAASVGLGDPELEGFERLNLAMVLSLLGEWQDAAPELSRALSLWQEIPSVDGTLAAVNVAGSLLLAAGDPSGAALVWAKSQVISDDRQIPIDQLYRDDEAFARVRGELGETYAEIETRAASASLDDAAEEVASRLRRIDGGDATQPRSNAENRRSTADSHVAGPTAQDQANSRRQAGPNLPPIPVRRESAPHFQALLLR